MLVLAENYHHFSPTGSFHSNQMTIDVFLSPQSIVIKLYPCLSSVFPFLFLMFICFPLLLTIFPQLILNFIHDSQCFRMEVRMEVLALSDILSHVQFSPEASPSPPNRGANMRHSSWTSSEAEQSHDPSSCASCHSC